MTSEATAKIISESGLAATELAPFAASAAIGDASTLRARIERLERVPALAEFARAAIRAMDVSAAPSGAEHVGRSLENLQAAATALLRHLHRSDALQIIGSEHALWVKLPMGLPLAKFSDCVARLSRTLEQFASAPQGRASLTVEAADIGPLWLRVGFESGSACAQAASALRSAIAIQQARCAGTGVATLLSSAEQEAHRIVSDCLTAASGPTTPSVVAEIVSAIVDLLAEGVEFRPANQAQDESNRVGVHRDG